MERRKLTKEDIDKVRNIEGFPIGTDDDIIALSDAPFYTACPNPFIEDFIKEYGTPYDAATDDYHRDPFAADVSEGKSDPIWHTAIIQKCRIAQSDAILCIILIRAILFWMHIVGPE